MRCVIIANAIKQRWPSANIRFILHQEAPYTASCPFETVTFSGNQKNKQYRNARYVLISKEIKNTPKNGIVFFDSAGRAKHFFEAWLHRVPVIFVSSREDIRRKGFNWLRLLPQKQHWMLRDIPTTPPAITRLLKWRAKINSVKLVDLPTLFNVGSPSNLSLTSKQPYMLLIHGGGTRIINGQPATTLFLNVAKNMCTHHKINALVIGGDTQDSTDQIQVIPWLDNADLMTAMEHACLNIVGGGSLVGQAIAQPVPTLAVSFGRKDQDARTKTLSAQGVLKSTAPRESDMSTSALSLLSSTSEQEAQLNKRCSLGIKNGIDSAMNELSLLLSTKK